MKGSVLVRVCLTALALTLALFVLSSLSANLAARALPGLGEGQSVTTNSGPLAPVAPLSYPPDPTADTDWSGGTSGVSDIQAAFNNARTAENSQLGTSVPMLTLPSQAEWDAKSDGEKALWLINRERQDRSVQPLHGLETNVTGVAQYYAQYLLDHDAWGHNADGRSPWQRLDANPAIGACHDFLNVAENLAVFVTSGSSIPLPIERAVYMWMYDDAGSGWGHRHAILWYPYNDNSGPAGREGFLGIGRANGGPYQGPFSNPWPFAEMIVMNVFDPCATWTYPSECEVPLTGVGIGGPTTGYTGTTYTFTAVLTPSTATPPATYTWSPEPDSGQSTASASYSWATIGDKTVSLTAQNCGGVPRLASHTITIQASPPSCTPLTGVTIQGPTTGYTDTTYAFTAVVAPSDATPPITYTWSPEPDSGQNTAGASYSWATTGSKVIRVAAVNCNGAGAAEDDHTIAIASGVQYYIYLPVVLFNF